MTADPASAPAPDAGNPGTAPRRRATSLWLRFGVALAAAIAAVIGATTWLQSRLVEGMLERELTETARLSALAASDELALRPDLVDPDLIEEHLRGFSETVPEIGSISVVAIANGRGSVVASTASTPPAGAVEAARRALETRDVAWGDAVGPLRVLASPVVRADRATQAVVITVSFDAVDRLRGRGRVIAAWATLCSGLVLFGVVELLVRSLIRRPIGAVRRTMQQVTGGDLAARAPVLRDDEIGAVATGLNRMLGEMEELHLGLQHRVAQATEEVRARNRELLDLYQQMFRLREELGRSQQLAAVGEMASAVAHQVGTPLNLVSGHLQLAMESVDAASPVARRIQVAEEQLHKVTGIVKDLLVRSRRPLRREPVDLLALLRRLCALVEPALGAANVTLRFEGMPVPPIDADPAQLELALLNLVSNAIDAMPGGGELGIRVAAGEGQAVVTVADTGSGIPPELAARIFEPWVTTKAAGRGTGLGLSIARSVIVEHGGSVTVDSAVGHGSTFTVTLPWPSSGAAAVPNHA